MLRWWMIFGVLLLGVGLVGAQEPDPIFGMAWNSTGEYLAISTRSMLKVVDRDGQILASTEPNYSQHIAWSPADPTLFATVDFLQPITLYRFENEGDLKKERSFGTSREVLAWSLDGKQLATTGQNEDVADVSWVAVWDVAIGELASQYRLEGPTFGDAAWRPGHPDEILLVAAENGYGIYFILWNSRTDKVIWETNEDFGSMQSVAWNADGSEFVSLSDDSTLTFFNGDDGAMLRSEGRTKLGYAMNVVWSPFENILIFYTSFAVFDPELGETIFLQRHTGEDIAITASPQGEITFGEHDITILEDVGLKPIAVPLPTVTP